MGGISRINGDGLPTDSAGSPATAEGLSARLSASQEASMRQLKEERDAARAQVADLEAAVTELVGAMDAATDAKVDIQTEFEAFKLKAEEDKAALAQAVETASRGRDHLDGIRARIAVFQAQAQELCQGKQRLVALLREARDEALALHRWNRQELRARREAEREAHQLRRQVARLMVDPRGGGRRGCGGAAAAAAAAAMQEQRGAAGASSGAVEEEAGHDVQAQEQESGEGEEMMAVDGDAQAEVEAAALAAASNNNVDEEEEEGPVVVEHAVVIASLESRVFELEAELARAHAAHEEALGQAAAARAEAGALAAARDAAVAQTVQAEQGVEGAVRGALEEREAEVAILRSELEAGVARLAEVDALERALAEEEGRVRALEARLADCASVVEEADEKARGAVDEIIGLRIREDELLAKVAELEGAHGACGTLISALREERDAWRQRAETGVAEWVGVAMDDGAEGTTTTSSPASDEAAAPVAAPDADADAGVETEAEMEAEAEAAAEVTATAVVVAINTPSSEELGGLDPVQALAEENEVLRAELARLRGVGGRM